MSAYEIPNMRFSAESGAAVARRRFVKIDVNEKGVQAGAGEVVVGVSMNEVLANEVLEIADGILMVEAAAPIASGVEVQSDLDGKAVVLAAGKKAGVTMTAAKVAGELVTVKLV